MTRGILAVGILILILVATVGIALCFGSTSVPAADIWAVLKFKVTRNAAGEPDSVALAIIWRLRMPRILLALLVGGGLAIIGVAMQTLVRNPLAEPYILGVSSGASVGASLFYLGFLPPIISRAVSMPIAAFVGALGAITAVYLVARTRSGLSTPRLLLAGVALSALLAAVTSFVTFASPEPERLRAVLFWLLGSFSGAEWTTLAFPATGTALGLLVLLGAARPLDAMLVGEEPARSLGVSVELMKGLLIILAALVTGVLVASSGIIGFVGLIIPHAVRFVVGVSHRKVIPAAFVAGAVFMVWADLAARTFLPAQELPVGILTAICGVPFFLVLLRRSGYH